MFTVTQSHDSHSQTKKSKIKPQKEKSLRSIYFPLMQIFSVIDKKCCDVKIFFISLNISHYIFLKIYFPYLVGKRGGVK